MVSASVADRSGVGKELLMVCVGFVRNWVGKTSMDIGFVS